MLRLSNCAHKLVANADSLRCTRSNNVSPNVFELLGKYAKYLYAKHMEAFLAKAIPTSLCFSPYILNFPLSDIEIKF